MDNNEYFFDKAFKVKGVTKNNRQNNLKFLCELSPKNKNICVVKRKTKDIVYWTVFYNNFEIGVISEEDEEFFYNSLYDYEITNIHIGDFVGNEGNKIYYARLFVRFYKKSKSSSSSNDLQNNNDIKHLTVAEEKYLKEEFKSHDDFVVINNDNIAKSYVINNYKDDYVQHNLSILLETDYKKYSSIYKCEIKHNREEIAIYTNDLKIGYIDRKYEIDYLMFKLSCFSCIIHEIAIEKYHDNNGRLILYPIITFLFHKIYTELMEMNLSDLQLILNKKPLPPHDYYVQCSSCKQLNPYFRDNCCFCNKYLFNDAGALYSKRKEITEKAQKELKEKYIAEHELNAKMHRELEQTIIRSSKRTNISTMLLILSVVILIAFIIFYFYK